MSWLIPTWKDEPQMTVQVLHFGVRGSAQCIKEDWTWGRHETASCPRWQNVTLPSNIECCQTTVEPCAMYHVRLNLLASS